MQHRAPLRFLRTCLVTTATLGLATTAHTAAGGHLPAFPVLALLTVLSLAPVMFLSRYRLGRWAMTGILGISQTALHFAFTVFAGASGHCTSGPGIAAYGHHQGITFPDCAGSVAGAVTGHELSGWPGAAMLAAHVLATAVTALLLARGEAALWQLLAWLKPRAAVRAPAPLPPCARIPAMHWETVVVPHPGRRIPALRGPPVPAVS